MLMDATSHALFGQPTSRHHWLWRGERHRVALFCIKLHSNSTWHSRVPTAPSDQMAFAPCV
jgi:hypothetical protein